MFEHIEIDQQNNTLRLHGISVDDYLDLLCCSLEEARLNDYYPSPSTLLTSLDAMDSATHNMLYDSLRLQIRSGLPDFREFVRVLADYRIAEKELRKLRSWERSRGEPIYEKLAQKRKYLAVLLEKPPVFEEQTRLLFRKIDKKTSMAKFRIILDRFSPLGMIDRLTVELSQENTLWGRNNLELNDDDVVHMSAHLKGLVYRLSTHDTEIIFSRLADLELTRVENVIRGTIGPLLLSYTEPIQNFFELQNQVGDGAIFSSSLQIASTEQQQDVLNDPCFPQLGLSVDARKEFCQSRRLQPFHVMRDRKFVVSEIDRARFSVWLKNRETKNIIYEV